MIVLVLPDIPYEDDLLARARRGDRDAIMEIYEYYSEPIYGYLRLRVGDPALAEDITSDVFLQFLSAVRGKKAPRYSLRGWLFKVARNLLAKHYKNIQKLPTSTLEEWIPSQDPDLEVHFLRSINIEQTRHALQMLNEQQQEVLVLRFGQSLSLEETADIMGKSVSAIKSLQFRAVHTLRQILTGG